MEDMDRAIEELEKLITGLFDQAMVVADRYWDHVTLHERRATGFESKSSLELSCGKRGNNLQIRWQGIKWVGGKSNRSRLRTPIARDKTTLGYSHTELKSQAKEWEWHMVQETELQMQSIRRQAYHIVKAIQSLRSAKSVRRVADEKLKELQAAD